MLAPSREFEFTPKDFETIRKMVYDNAGIVLQDHKKDMVYSRIARRLRTLGLQRVKDYIHFVETEGQAVELVQFVNAITTNLTRFFREPHHFEFLEKKLRERAILARSTPHLRRIRIWSAGCSSGEEPYSIAMTVMRSITSQQGFDIKILATDLDTNMLDKGRAGIYKMDDLETIPAPYRAYAEKNNTNLVRMKPALQAMIHFKQLNLMGHWPMKGPFDFIFCRNVMIYFDGPTKAKLVNRFDNLLDPNGNLFVGHSESVISGNHGLKLMGRTIYKKIDGGQDHDQ